MCRLPKIFIIAALMGAFVPRSSDAQQSKNTKPSLQWTDARELTVEGMGWSKQVDSFCRLPDGAKGVVRDAVWNLSRDSAGVCIRFSTTATEIRARWTLRSKSLAMPHMPATGVSGVDLYVQVDGKWKWLANGRPSAQSSEATLAKGLAAEPRQYMLYLPLYNGVTEVKIGANAPCLPGAERSATAAKPLVFYGTSITQGGCASRPGMVHTALLGRWLERPVINLGFSGNGKMEQEVGRFLNQIDAAVFVIDCLPNMDASAVQKRTEPLVRQIREAHPNTPILLVEDRNYSNGFLVQRAQSRNQTNQAALRAEYEKLVADGVKHLHYLEAKGMLGDDNEGTVDSSHPTDLGFWRQAKLFQKALAPLLVDDAVH